MDAYFRWKFTVLFLWLLVAVLIHPFVLHDERYRTVFVVVSTLYFGAAILSLGEIAWQRWTGLLLGTLCILGRWTEHLFRGQRGLAADVADRALQIVFLSFTVAVLLVAIFRKRTVTLDSLLGAFGGYLLIAVAWGLSFSLVELLSPGSFYVAAQLRQDWDSSDEHREWLLSYFSCCTLMTVGYGDITPVLPVARTLAVLEAMTGQIYLAVLLAVLVGAKVTQAGNVRSA
jgi:hypothetical protein